MDHIDMMLTNHHLDHKLDPAIQKSIGLTKKTLNRYYKLSDLSATFRLALRMYYCTAHMFSISDNVGLVLNPRFKTQYFIDARWSPEWIKNVTEMARDEFDRKYKNLAPLNTAGTAARPANTQGDVTSVQVGQSGSKVCPMSPIVARHTGRPLRSDEDLYGSLIPSITFLLSQRSDLQPLHRPMNSNGISQPTLCLSRTRLHGGRTMKACIRAYPRWLSII